jgi:hypothetical protein
MYEIAFYNCDFLRFHIDNSLASETIAFVVIQFRMNGLMVLISLYPGNKLLSIDPDMIPLVPLVWDPRLEPTAQCPRGDVKLCRQLCWFIQHGQQAGSFDDHTMRKVYLFHQNSIFH